MKINKIVIKISILFFTLILNFNSLFANNDDASLWVENIGKSALSILGEQNITDDKKEILLEEIFIKNLDIRRISLFVLGPYRKGLDKESSGKYFKSIEDFISKVYSKRLLSYPSGNIQIIKNENKGKRGNIVYSSIQFNDRPKPISIDWWVIKNRSGINKVFDMRISGIWMAQEQRSTFTSFLSKNDGDINKLIERLNVQSR
tara:strand:+ start:1414 stop:2022 length:609 start_codon:yes stop_codon:yes gene_type:complete